MLFRDGEAAVARMIRKYLLRWEVIVGVAIVLGVAFIATRTPPK
jgi:hypothetical protein